jgi:hypothetical protein
VKSSYPGSVTTRTSSIRNFLFGLEKDAIIRPSRLIATSRNDFSI